MFRPEISPALRSPSSYDSYRLAGSVRKQLNSPFVAHGHLTNVSVTADEMFRNNAEIVFEICCYLIPGRYMHTFLCFRRV